MTRRAWLGLALLTLGLRLARAPARWDEIALAYAAYAEPVQRALDAGEAARAVATWVGLHPPLHAALLWGLERLWPAPAAWLGLSLLASAGAALLLGRAGGAVAMAALATAPLQLAYAAEVNNYPLAVLALALTLATARGAWPALAASVIFAGWAHLLAGLGALGVVVWRAIDDAHPRRERGALLLAVGLGLLPVAAGALRRLGWESTFAQPALEGGALAWLGEAASRVGPEGIALGALALLGLRGPALAMAAPLGLLLALSLGLGAAAPHQFPYLLLFGPPLALAAEGAASRPWARRLILALALFRGGRAGAEEIGVLRALAANQGIDRAIDATLREARPGDRIWLVAPALRPDDDKSDTSPVLWRLSPWAGWARAPLAGFEFADPRAGSPRRWRGMTVHASTGLDEAALDAAAGPTLATGGRLWVVLYEHGPALGLAEEVERALRPYRWERRSFAADPELGPDLLYRVEGRR